MSTSESCVGPDYENLYDWDTSENCIGRDYENSYDCNVDSDSECSSLVKKFNSLFGDNRFVKTGDNECQPMAERENTNSSTTSLEPDPYGEIWKKEALQLITSIRGNITNYNKGKAFFYVNVAGYYGKANDSGIGVLIRNRHGVPIDACSWYEANVVEKVSPFFQELRAVNRGLDMADKLGLKYIHLICTSTDVSYAITSCDRGVPIEDRNHLVHNLSLQIIDKLQKQRNEKNYFSNFAGGKIDNIAARYLARLKENEEEMGPEMLRKHDNLMDIIFKDATGLSDVALYYNDDQ